MSTTSRRTYRYASEADLLSWARAGDPQAFAALVEPHRRMLISVCARIAGEDAAAQDAVQSALLAAWRNLASFQGRSRFSTWLCQIGHNEALGQVRRRRPEPVAEVPESSRVPTTSLTGDLVTTVHAVRWALAKLHPDFRAALVLREFGDLTYDEIAEAQGIPVQTVKSRISRARQGMAALLTEPGALTGAAG
jgi:RNA polymerase sigma factor (sigma-70 family)